MRSQPATVFLLPLAALILFGCATPPKHHGNPEAARIARTYGLPEFDRVEAIRYTFNVKLPDKTVSRSWVWEPKPDRVTFTPAGENPEPVTYLRENREAAGVDRKIDAWFVNDNFWLLFPFHVEWTPNLTFSSAKNQPLPLSDGRADRVTVQFPGEKGYTPGDAYDLFYGPTYRIQEWVYRKGGAAKPTRATTWEAHAKAGPILLSLDHRGENDFRVWFTDVAVRPAGSDDWLPASRLQDRAASGPFPDGPGAKPH
ncbi:MAG: hypothetical protein ACLFRG_01225 [Desulfococcaceae bacterium]